MRQLIRWGIAPPYFYIVFCLLRRIGVPYIGFIILIFSFIGCGVKGQSIDIMYNSASSQIDKAREVGAEQFASDEFHEAQDILNKVKSSNDNKEKETLLQKASALARFAEALTRQKKVEAELAKIQDDEQKIELHLKNIRSERQLAEETLKQLNSKTD